jgi:hypothetical protein
VLPEDGHRLLQHLISAKALRPSHGHIIR